MRPLRLTFAAVGPYVDPLTLDFRSLGANRIGQDHVESPRGTRGRQMKPLRLQLAAFGPYVDPLTLDFCCLGATGSGKTMLHRRAEREAVR
jgi:hypothetical protein